jgi:hypothetical protein
MADESSSWRKDPTGAYVLLCIMLWMKGGRPVRPPFSHRLFDYIRNCLHPTSTIANRVRWNRFRRITAEGLTSGKDPPNRNTTGS